jgi:hypothetical protein
MWLASASPRTPSFACVVPGDCNEVLVRVLHRRADLHEHHESRGGVEAARLAVLVDRLPFDELHREVRQAVGRRAAVEQS